MNIWLSWLRPGDLFVDVGANIGIYSIIASEAGASVIAIEPDHSTAALLVDNMQLNSQEWNVVEAALSDHDGSGRFTAGLDTVNLLREDGEQSVRVMTLDQILQGRRARGVKIDVEGHEACVLRGASKSLRDQRIDLIQMEWGGDRSDEIRLLRSAGYEFLRSDPEGSSLVPTSEPVANEVFARPARSRPSDAE